MKTPLHRDKNLVRNGTQILHEMREMCSSLTYVALLTDDGFNVVRLDDSQVDPNRFASMASSMEALGEAVAKELSIGESPYIIIASDNGHLIQWRVPGQPLVLSALFDSHESLGKALSVSRVAAATMSDYLSP